MIKKQRSKVNTSSTSHREFQRRKDKTENKGPRNKNQIKDESSPTPVQGPSTVACVIVTSLSQLTH
jgi:hypothetical protein